MNRSRQLECSFLIPVLRDSDRQPHQPVTWRQLEDALIGEFGGRTGPGRVIAFKSAELLPGSWVPEGAEGPIEDESVRYWVSVPEDRIDALRNLLRKAANTFDQQSIYLSVAAHVEYVQPTPDDGFLE